MAYTKQTFINNSTVLTAEMMNHIEDGIVENEDRISQLSSNLIESEISYFGMKYTDATEVIDLSDFVKMYLFATTNGYDAVVTGSGAIPDYTISVSAPLFYEIETVNRPYDAEKINRMHICDGITSIGDYFMHKAYNLQHLSFEDSTKITHIGKCVFSLTQISGEYDFSGMTDTIIDCAFKSCPKLQGITLGGNISVIKDYSFRDCLSLRYVHNITKNGANLTINKASFYYCTNLESIAVEPENTTLGNWVFMFAPIDAKTQNGIILSSASWKSKGKMCFVENEWTQQQLDAIRNVTGKSAQLTIPKSNNQKSDFNKQYGVFPWEIDGKYTPRSVTAAGSCGFFSLFHTYNIVYPNRQCDTYYDFIEKCIVPNKIEVTQELYDALANSPIGQKFITDMSGIVSYEVGSKIPAIHLPLNLLDASSYGDIGTAFWGICESLGWTAIENKFTDRDVDTAEDRKNCGAIGKQIVLDSIYDGRPVIMEVVGAGGVGSGAHAAVAIGYDASTDKFLMIDSTWEFPSHIMPMLYWCKFESLITPDVDSSIWTFDFGEEISMTNIDNKLNTLLNTVNSGFHSVSGLLSLENDVPSASATTSSTYNVACPSNAKIFIFEADDDTAAQIKTRTDAYYMVGACCNFANPIALNTLNGLSCVWAGQYSKIVNGGIAISNDNGVSFESYRLAAGNYKWTAYYWND